MESVLSTYTVSLESPLLEGPFVAEVTASSQAAAIRRVQYSAFHLYQAVEMLHAECTITEDRPTVLGHNVVAVSLPDWQG